MNDIVNRLKSINEQSLIMAVVRDCMDAAAEIEALRADNAAKAKALQQVKNIVLKEEQSRPK